MSQTYKQLPIEIPNPNNKLNPMESLLVCQVSAPEVEGEDDATIEKFVGAT